ncbi:hypothetical protein M5D96_005483 [Drosophila gunungcola]|uniref:Uncharacterized protein n=1 Tax=Drosophila gunungcola TaxID=103775 RepID=A0A9P9YQE1_9MUSC|nr:hypothetical protein M5D96_005483 [Drosophila gunungcola]
MQHEPEEQTFQLQALEIREPDASFDPKKPPESGEEYLMHMMYERKRCPAVVTKRSPKIKDNAGNKAFEMLDNVSIENRLKTRWLIYVIYIFHSPLCRLLSAC